MRIAGVEVPPEVVTLVLEGKKIQAIKLARTKIRACAGLREAKEFVDQIVLVVSGTSAQSIVVENGGHVLADWMTLVEKKLKKLEIEYHRLCAVVDALEQKEGGDN